MIFTLEALQAFHGDCLIVHAGPAARPHLLLIDGGPTATWATSLKPRLDEIRAALSPGADLLLDLAVISHMDGDHIQGMLAFARSRDQAPSTTPYEPDVFWHNAFDDVLGNRAEDLRKAAVAGRLDGADTETQLVIASVPEGRQMRDAAQRLTWTINDGKGGLVAAGAPGDEIDVGDGVKLKVAGPIDARLEALHDEWETWLTKHPGAVAPAALTDSSVFNRSSIVLLLEADGKRMLLTGDARGDDIRAGLAQIGAVDGGVTDVDVLKVPHHGSDRNVDVEFFKAVRARHYVISADGKHGNPDIPTLDMIAAARPDDDFTLHLTNHDGQVPKLGPLRPLLDAWIAKHSGRSFKTRFRDPAALSLRIDLADELPY